MRQTVQVLINVHALVDTTLGFAVHRTPGIHQTRALLKEAVGQTAVGFDGGIRRGHQAAFNIIRAEPRRLLQHQRSNTTDHGRSLRGTRHQKVTVAIVKFRMLPGDVGIAAHRAHHMATGCCYLGLNKTFHGWSRRRKGRQVVILKLVRRVMVSHGTNGQHIRDVTRHTDGHGFRAGITSGNQHHNARPPGGHNCQIQRVLPVMGHGRATEGQIHYSNVVLLLMGNHKGNGSDHVQVGAPPLFIKGPDDDQIGIWRYPMIAARSLAVQVKRLAGTGEDTGDVAAMAIVIKHRQRRTIFDGVIIGSDTWLVEGIEVNGLAGPATRVDDGNPNSLPRHPLHMQQVSVYQGGEKRVPAAALHGQTGVKRIFNLQALSKGGCNLVVIRQHCRLIFKYQGDHRCRFFLQPAPNIYLCVRCGVFGDHLAIQQNPAQVTVLSRPAERQAGKIQRLLAKVMHNPADPVGLCDQLAVSLSGINQGGGADLAIHAQTHHI